MFFLKKKKKRDGIDGYNIIYITDKKNELPTLCLWKCSGLFTTKGCTIDILNYFKDSWSEPNKPSALRAAMTLVCLSMSFCRISTWRQVSHLQLLIQISSKYLWFSFSRILECWHDCINRIEHIHILYLLRNPVVILPPNYADLLEPLACMKKKRVSSGFFLTHLCCILFQICQFLIRCRFSLIFQCTIGTNTMFYKIVPRIYLSLRALSLKQWFDG